MQEKRQHPRSTLHASATLSHPSFHATVRVIDISAGGIAVDIGSTPKPPVGTLIDVMIKKATGPINKTPVTMRITHIQANGIMGLAFV